MKSIKLRHIQLLLFLLLIATITFGQRKRPYTGSRIFWDKGSYTEVFRPGNYARMIQLQDGRLMAVAEALGGTSISFSNNMGSTWEPPRKIASPPEKVAYANAEVIQLEDGTLLVGINARPRTPYSAERRFGIWVVRSTDNGDSWSAPIFVYEAQHVFTDGCWEPAFLELPSGEVQCYFANENDYTTNNDQNISMCRSFDKGLTWSLPVTVSYRQGARDGMPVPVLLPAEGSNEAEIAVIIEDNGWPGRGNFAATTVRNKLADNWTKGYVDATSSNRAMIFEKIPASNIVSAAPYIRRLPWGETVASFQTNENRISNDLQYFDMHVLVGDSRARNFKAQSAPFALSNDKHAIWNSVAVIDTGIVVAVASIGPPNGQNDVIMMKGYPIRQARADYGSITVDGKKTSEEKWTSPNMAQLHFGVVSNTRTMVDFLYDDQYLYVTSRVIDRNIINSGVDNDGVRFMIDVEDVSGISPQQGMYSFFFDTNGTVKFQKGENGKWVTEINTSNILYAIDIRSSYYNIEAAIPWSLMGKTSPPTNNRMAIAFEVVNKEQYTRTVEGIADALSDQSWSWLEFVLGEQKTAVFQQNRPKITTLIKNNTLYLRSPVSIELVSLYSFTGKLIDWKKNIGLTYQTNLLAEDGGVLSVSLENGETIVKKVL